MRWLMKSLLVKLKWRLASKELTELARWRFTHTQYSAYLSDFEDVSLVLKNMAQEVKGHPSTVSGYDPVNTGPFDANGLRYRLGRVLLERKDKCLKSQKPTPP